jgi:tRNA (guanine37-N1)-methyltransferase
MFSIKAFTLFPELFPGPLGASVVGRALEQKIWQLDVVNIRDYATDKHKTVDDMAFGGGPGMIMRADVIDAALKAHYGTYRPSSLIYMSPRGHPLTQDYIKKLASAGQVGILCGRFEGVDQRVLDLWEFEELSLGDFVLSGGEIAAYALIDACVRLLPGVVGQPASLEEESFSKGLLEYPQYTRPREWKDCKVPEVLLSGNHQLIQKWRQEKSEEFTRDRRPDLWGKYLERHKKSC